MTFNGFCLFAGIVENMTGLKQEVALTAGEQGLILWILRRLKVTFFLTASQHSHEWFNLYNFYFISLIDLISLQKLPPYDANKLYASEILSILLQNTEGN